MYFKEPSGVTKQIFDDHAPYSIGIHCMPHHTNLVVQILSGLPLVKHIESLLQTLHAYFAHSPKRYLEFTKLVEVMETKRNKILHNVKIRWISMLSLAKKVLAKYGTLLMKRAMDCPTNHQVELNYEHLCDLQTLLGLASNLLLLESIHVFIKFAQM
jgi:hypothetical protein